MFDGLMTGCIILAAFSIWLEYSKSKAADNIKSKMCEYIFIR